MSLKFYLEMAKPRKEDLAKKYYHGTSNKKAADGILKEGVKVPKIAKLDPKYSMVPRKGKVYITPEIKYAIIYAINGDIAGSDYYTKKELNEDTRYGYVFEIDGKDLKDIEPDEDSIGEMIANKNPKWLYELFMDLDIFEEELPDDIVQDMEDYNMSFHDLVMDGNYAAWAEAGKIVVNELSDEEKLELISLGAHIAHTGNIKISGAWKIDKLKTKQLKRDGSNFFKIAEKIK